MFKKRSIQVKLVPDQETADSSETVSIDPSKVIDDVVVGAMAIIIVTKLTTLLCSVTEHVVSVKVK